MNNFILKLRTNSEKVYLYLFILSLNFAFSGSYFLDGENISTIPITEKSRNKRAIARHPDSRNITTASQNNESPYNKYFQPYKPRLTFGFHIEQMRSVSEIEKIIFFDATVTV